MDANANNNGLPLPIPNIRRPCCLLTVKILKAWINFFQLSVYYAIIFIAIVSVSIGLVTLTSFLKEVCWGSGFSEITSSIITLSFVAFWGECHAIVQATTRFGRWIRKRQKRHPFILCCFPWIIYTTLYLVALWELCKQYMIVHGIEPWTSLGFPEYQKLIYDEEDHQRSKRAVNSTAIKLQHYKNTSSEDITTTIERQTSEALNDPTFIFLLSLSYMTYMAARCTDWTYYRCSNFNFLVNARLGSFCTCCGFYVIQLVLLIMYVFPLLFICLVCRFMYCSAEVAYLLINLLCIVLGMNAIDLEAKKPFPIAAQVGPDYYFENHLMARAFLLSYQLYPLVVVPFFMTNNIIPPTNPLGGLFFTPGSRFYLFLIIVGCTFLQTVKTVFNVFYSKDQIFYEHVNRNHVPHAVGDDPGALEAENGDNDDEDELQPQQQQLNREPRDNAEAMFTNAHPPDTGIRTRDDVITADSPKVAPCTETTTTTTDPVIRTTPEEDRRNKNTTS